VVLSRHNLRAPLSGGDSVLGKATDHEWFSWTANPKELSVKGGLLETEMGLYFRKWLEAEGLIPENYVPEGDEVRFYANARQRTIATSRYFASGMLPVAEIPVETHGEMGEFRDPVFSARLTFVNDAFEEKAREEIREMTLKEGEEGPDGGLEESYDLLMDVLDMEDSSAVKNGELKPLEAGDTAVSFEVGEETVFTGSMKNANTISDTLVLQYYEMEDSDAAAFGHELTEDQWVKIAEAKDQWVRTKFSPHSVAVNISHGLIGELNKELQNKDRRFAFLCGHDSNLMSVLGALRYEPYDLPDAIEKSIPIGAKIVFEVREKDGEEFCDISLVYQSLDQLLHLQQLSLENPPVRYSLSFQGLERNEDGLYRMEDVLQRFDETLAEYETLKNAQADETETAQAQPETEVKPETEVQFESETQEESELLAA
jgi:glucose-1-phosphatase